MQALKEEQILQALKSVTDPADDRDIVSTSMVKGLQISDRGDVLFMIEVDPKKGPALEPLRQRAEDVVRGLPGVQKVTAVLTAEQQAEPVLANTSIPDPHGMGKNPKLDLPIKRIIAVASGKGGVGKSTIAAYLARQFVQNKNKYDMYRIGILDADIYGPSQPKLMGLEEFKPKFTQGNRIIPAEIDGLKIMSIGFMVDAEKALIWRGPMVQSALYQMLRDVEWGNIDEPLDLLIIDMPPGTGDAQLTLAQKIKLDGAVIVSTPQDLALIDARKAVEMFRTIDVPVLGMVENMSTHICTNCGHEDPIFGQDGARAEAEKLGIPILGQIPLSADIRSCADAGREFSIDAEIDIDALL